MEYNINLLKSIFKVNLAQFLTYRVEFWLNLLDSCVWFLITISFYKYIYSTALAIPGVSLTNVYLIVATSEIVKSLLFTFCINNLAAIPAIVRDGTLDGFLLKPINSQFLISFRKINFGNLGNFIPAIVLLWININNVSITNISWYIILVISSFILGYSLWFMLMTCSIWLVQLEDLHELFLGILTLNQFPLSAFRTGGKLIYYLFLPILLTSNMPVLTAFTNHHTLLSNLSYILLAILVYILSNLFWKFSIKHYSSVSN